MNNSHAFNPYAKRSVSLLLNEDSSESDEMGIQKILKQAGAIMQPTTDYLEMFRKADGSYAIAQKQHASD